MRPPRISPTAWPLLALPLLASPFTTVRSAAPAGGPRFAVRVAPGLAVGPLDGRLLLLVSKDESQEPRFQIEDGPRSQQVFGIDVDGWAPGAAATFDPGVLGYPLESLGDLRAGTYTVQALLHRYETFHRRDGHTVKLPMDRGEGQQWNRAPGNLYSTPRQVTIDPAATAAVEITLDKVIPPIPDPPTTKYIRHERIQSERLTEFWGRPMYLGAHILVPEGFDAHPEARYPLVIYHGHFPQTIDGFREEPPDPDLEPDYSERFHWAGYNRTQQEWAYQLYRDWTAPGYPRMLVVEIQHANPYYDDSYAVNSANLGPYGDAITYELIPYLEKKYRALGAGWARFMYGGSTGGWEAMAAQIFYPDEYNGAWCACPDPIDFRAYTVVDLYKDTNAYWREGPFLRVPRPAKRDYLGHVSGTIEQLNRMELVLGDKSRSGQQWDIWEAVYSPVGADGYPRRIWDKRTGVIDPEVAAHWRENYDLGYILRRDWNKGLGRKLEGKLSLYVGDMDNYYLNNAVYLVEEFLKSTRDPAYGGEVTYGDRAEHCWNGDPTRPNAISRLRYHQMFAPKIVARIEKSAPAGADLKSWRY
jgi:putative esterase